MSLTHRMQLFDIGANLTDGMFKGMYNGKLYHGSDLGKVLERAVAIGVTSIMLTAGSLSEAQEALRLVDEIRGSHPQLSIWSTVGVHPTRCGEFLADPKRPSLIGEVDHEEGALSYMDQLVALAKNTRVAAIGEFGLDYSRLQYCSKDVQRNWFERQLQCICPLLPISKPLFLHMRDAADDFIAIIERNRHLFTDGVVHSFTGTLEEALRIITMDLYIGINGCSLKTADNIATIRGIPLERMMVESDAPWCEIRPTHAGFQLISSKLVGLVQHKQKATSSDAPVKGRNEPFACRQVVEAIAAIKEVPLDVAAATIYENSRRIFGRLH